jgi:uncharacterized protein YciI
MNKILTVLFLLSVCNGLHAQETMSLPEVQAELAKAKNYTLVFFLKGPKEEKENDAAARELHMKHLQYLFGLKKNNVLSIFGPLTDNGTIKGILIFNSTDQVEVKKYLDADNYVKAGYMAYELHPWFGIPGQSLAEK